MVVDDLDVECIVLSPTEANTPLIVYPNAVLPFAPALQSFEAVTGGHPEIIQSPRLMQIEQLPSSDPLNGTEPSNGDIVAQRLDILAFERTNHLHASLSRGA